MTQTQAIEKPEYFESFLAKRLIHMGIDTSLWSWLDFKSIFGFEAPLECLEQFPTQDREVLTSTPGWSYPSKSFVPDEKELRIALLNMQRKCNFMMVGPTGCGKTFTIEQLCWRLGLPVFTIACNAETDYSTLFGKTGIKNGNTYFDKGLATIAVETHGVVFLDEVTSIDPSRGLDMNPLLENRDIIIEAHGEINEMVVKNAGFCQVVGSSNTGGKKTGNRSYKNARVQDLAWRDRWNLLNSTYKDMKVEREILRKVFTNTSPESLEIRDAVITKLLDFAGKMRDCFLGVDGEAEVSSPVSLRGLVSFCQFLEMTADPVESYQLTIEGRIEEDEKEVFKTEFETSFDLSFEARKPESNVA